MRLARELRPAVITLDVLMPGMDGWQVLAALKADPDLALIPVIILTMLDDRDLGYALGASAFLTKPVDRERLIAVLKQYEPERSEGTVLIVEDDAATRETLRHALTKAGWTVAEAENGRVALACIAAQVPALILLDLMMPEMDGFDIVAALGGRTEWRRVPVIVLTARDLTAEDRARLNGYVHAILQKGARHRDELLAEVRSLVAARVPRTSGAAH